MKIFFDMLEESNLLTDESLKWFSDHIQKFGIREPYLQSCEILFNHQMLPDIKALKEFYIFPESHIAVCHVLKSLEKEGLLSTSYFNFSEIQHLANHIKSLPYLILLKEYGLVDKKIIESFLKYCSSIGASENPVNEPESFSAYKSILDIFKRYRLFKIEYISQLFKLFKFSPESILNSFRALSIFDEFGFLSSEDITANIYFWFNNPDIHAFIVEFFQDNSRIFRGKHKQNYLYLFLMANKDPILLELLVKLHQDNIFQIPLIVKEIKNIFKHKNPFSLIEALLFLCGHPKSFQRYVDIYYKQLISHKMPHSYIQALYFLYQEKYFKESRNQVWIDPVLNLTNPDYFLRFMHDNHMQVEARLDFIQAIRGYEAEIELIIKRLTKGRIQISETNMGLLKAILSHQERFRIYEITSILEQLHFFNPDNAEETLIHLLSHESLNSILCLFIITRKDYINLFFPLNPETILNIISRQDIISIASLVEHLYFHGLLKGYDAGMILKQLFLIDDTEKISYVLTKLLYLSALNESLIKYPEIKFLLSNSSFHSYFYYLARLFSPELMKGYNVAMMIKKFIQYSPILFNDENILINLTHLADEGFKILPAQLDQILEHGANHAINPERFKKLVDFYMKQSLMNIHPTYPPASIIRRTPQTTHLASINEAVRNSLSKLEHRYHLELEGEAHKRVFQEIQEFIFSQDLSIIQNQAAESAIIRLITEPNDFTYPETDITKYQLLLLAYTAIMDDQQRLSGCSREEAKLNFIKMLYEIQRGYNIDEHFTDDGLPDRSLCNIGTYHKCIEYLASIHPDCELIYVSQEIASSKFIFLVRQECNKYLQALCEFQEISEYESRKAELMKIKHEGHAYSIWEIIKDNVLSQFMDEYKTLYITEADSTGLSHRNLEALCSADALQYIEINVEVYEEMLEAKAMVLKAAKTGCLLATNSMFKENNESSGGASPHKCKKRA